MEEIVWQHRKKGLLERDNNGVKMIDMLYAADGAQSGLLLCRNLDMLYAADGAPAWTPAV